MQAEVARDHELSLIRRAVESLFGPMKHSYRLAPMRAFTCLRNMTDLSFFASPSICGAGCGRRRHMCSGACPKRQAPRELILKASFKHTNSDPKTPSAAFKPRNLNHAKVSCMRRSATSERTLTASKGIGISKSKGVQEAAGLKLMSGMQQNHRSSRPAIDANKSFTSRFE